MTYFLHIFIIINVYIILAVSLNLLSGYSGLLSLCHAGFFGIGAYTAALLTIKFAWQWLPSVFLGLIIAGLLSLIIGVTSLRFRNDYFIIATFAFQVILFSILQNWVSLTDGPLGLPGIPQPILFGWEVNTHFEFSLLSLVLSAGVFFIVWKLVNAPYGRVLKAIREDELFAQSLGKNINSYKISAFIISAILASTAGSFFAAYLTYIDPDNFTIHESIFILAIVIIGGSGNLWGSVLGAAFLVSIPEVLRLLGLPSGSAANVQQILYGTLLVTIMLLRPQGLIGEFDFRQKIE